MNEREPEPEGHGDGWFPVEVTIRDTQTDEVRIFATWENDKGGWSDFNWSENNFSCDCNRHLFFERAAGRDVQDTMEDDRPCGDGGYRVESIKDCRDGRILYEEKE